MLCSALAYTNLVHVIVAQHGPDSKLARELGNDGKGLLSLMLYLCAIGLAFLEVLIADALYLTVAIIWFVPDKRLERAHAHE